MKSNKRQLQQERERFFFLPLWAKPKSWKQQKNKQKKKGFAAFLFVSSQQAKANVFFFFILVKTKKEQTLAGEVVAFFFSVSSKRPIEKANVFYFCFLFFLLLPGFYVCFFFYIKGRLNMAISFPFSGQG